MTRLALLPAIFLVSMMSAASAQEAQMTMTENENRPGMDYRNFALDTADPALCQRACLQEERCRSYTFVEPGRQGPAARCWLKYGIPPAANDACCVSGLKEFLEDPATGDPAVARPRALPTRSRAGLQQLAATPDPDRLRTLLQQAYDQFRAGFPGPIPPLLRTEGAVRCAGSGCLGVCSGFCPGNGGEGMIAVAPLSPLVLHDRGTPLAFVARHDPDGESGFFLVRLADGGRGAIFVDEAGRIVSGARAVIHQGAPTASALPTPIPEPPTTALRVQNVHVRLLPGAGGGTLWIGERQANGQFHGISLISATPINHP